MRILKRRSSEEVIAEQFGENWRNVFYHPVIAAITGSKLHHQTVTAEHIMFIASQCKRNTLSGVELQDKIFLYVLCSIMWRCFGDSLLSDPDYNTLQRHLRALTTIDKIEQGHVPLPHRQAFLWDMPEIHKRYRKAGIMETPRPPFVEKPKRLKRLPAHKKRMKR